MLRGRRLAAVLALTIVFCGCGLLPAGGSPRRQGGDPEIAREAAHAFLNALVNGRTAEAWSHLTPATQQTLYGNDVARFGRDVVTAEWSRFRWDFGPITDHEISWGLHLVVDQAAVPSFLIERELVGRWHRGIVLLVQTPERQPYLVAAQGLDTELRPP